MIAAPQKIVVTFCSELAVAGIVVITESFVCVFEELFYPFDNAHTNHLLFG